VGAPQICWDAVGMDESLTRTEKRAVDAGEDVEWWLVAPPPSCPTPATQLLPWLRGSEAETLKSTLPAASVHETRRTCDSGTPVALAKEQRRSVMLESVRTALWASRTMERTENGGGGEEAMPAPSPTPRPMASAARTARRRQHGQNAASGRRLSLLVWGAVAAADTSSTAAASRTARSTIRCPDDATDTATASPSTIITFSADDAILLDGG
jgi:hypothetical protein